MGLGRKTTGGKYKFFSKKKKYSREGIPRVVKLRITKKKTIRGMGANKKTVLLSEEFANVYDKDKKISKKVKIKNVLETPSNRFLARQNILVKSAIIDTELGKAKITNRPSQEAMVQAVLIKE
jgi:small subunit ribosomal protein S8e